MNPPGDLSGNSPLAVWLRKLRAYAISSRLQRGPRYKLKEGPGGMGLDFDFGPGGSALAGVRMYKITALNGDYFTAVTRAWDGTTETLGNSSVQIAKSPAQRTSVASEVIDAVNLTYVYSDDNNRVANDGTKTEQQVVFPRYRVGDIIFAQESANGTGVIVGDTSLTWLESKPDRVWAKRYSQ